MKKLSLKKYLYQAVNPFRVKLLYLNVLQFQKETSNDFHQHSYWQLEVVKEGLLLLHLRSQVIELRSGDLYLIPPEVEHRFSYPKKKIKTVSIKFEVPEYRKKFPEPGLLHGSSWYSTLRESVLSFLPNAEAEWLHDELGIALLSHYLGALLEIFHRPQMLTTKKENLEKSIREVVQSYEGRSVTIAALAKKFSYTPNYLSALFRETSKIPLKKFMDQERARLAQNLLVQTEESILSISRRLDFPDVLIFSRFFKRHHQLSPRAFRNQLTGC